MYCSSCGAALRQGLSYCNHCGAKLASSDKSDKAQGKPIKLSEVADNLAVALIFVALFGFSLTYFLASLMLKNNVGLGLTTFSIIMTLLVTSGLSGLIIHQLSHVLKVYLQSASGDEGKKEKLEAKRRVVAEIEATPELAPSVIENTTRELEPAYKDQNK
ncbi:MAG: zinc ribbon domain-containing protein [Acidobacteria bacterium]|nr:zinc ribbon domain-containing protein [Acidobacteriota bacterium]